MRKFITRAITALLVGALVMSPVSPASAASKKIALSKKKLVLQVGKKQKIKIKNYTKKVTWSIRSGKKYIKLQKKQKNSVVILAKKPGKAKVQAKIGKKKYLCHVIVKAVAEKETASPTVIPTATPLLTAPPSSMLLPTKDPAAEEKPTNTPVPQEKNADQAKALKTLIRQINTNILKEYGEKEIEENGYLVATDIDDDTQYEWDEQGNLSAIFWADKGITEKKISFAAFPHLRGLYCQYNEGIEGIDVSANPELEDLFCSDDGITSLDLTANRELIELHCSDNMISAKKFKYNRCTKLQVLQCGNNEEMQSINVSSMPDLRVLECADSGLVSTIDVSANPKLVELNCKGNDAMGANGAELIVNHAESLEILNCSDCGLTSLDVSQNPALVTLKCSDNDLTVLNTDHNPLLQTLECDNNGYTAEDKEMTGEVGSGGGDFVDDPGSDPVGGSDPSENDPEQTVTLQMDVSKNTVLGRLVCYGNGLSALDVSQNPELTYLDCSDNHLTTLDISRNTGLAILNCSLNHITSLDISANPLLWNSTTLQYDQETEIIGNDQ